MKNVTESIEDVQKHNNTRKMYQIVNQFNTLQTGDADLRLYITTVQDG